MTVVKLTTARIVPAPRVFQSYVTGVTNAEDNSSRNVTDGPADVYAFELNNLVASGSKNWLKAYDDATTAWNPGTTKPVFIMPCPAYAAASSRAAGFATAYCLDGYPFDEGVSLAASQEGGDTMTAAPEPDFNIHVLHRDKTATTASSAPAALTSGTRTQLLGGGKEEMRVYIGGSDATPANDVYAGTGDDTITIYRVYVNAALNPAEDVYVRLYNHKAPTVGGAEGAELLIPCKRGRVYTWQFPNGVVFSPTDPVDGDHGSLSIATVKNKGATSGNDSPSGTVDVIVDFKYATS